MSVVIAGGAGFIGSRLVKHFSRQNIHALVLDNLIRGNVEFIDSLSNQQYIHFEQIDVSDVNTLGSVIKSFHKLYPINTVWHMAANSDIPAGIADACIDFRNTFQTTFALLQTMKTLHISSLAFASSSAIYGNFGASVPLHEDIGPLRPISNYGAMKLASEAAISAACESWLERAWVFRFPNVVGTPATHGVILDFVCKLLATPSRLEVLGDGTQQKVYLHVDDLLDAMFFIVNHARDKHNVYNIGPKDTGCSVRRIAEMVASEVSPGASIVYGRESRGWVGDVPKFSYSVEKLARLGWQVSHTSLDAVRKAVREIAEQER